MSIEDGVRELCDRCFEDCWRLRSLFALCCCLRGLVFPVLSVLVYPRGDCRIILGLRENWGGVGFVILFSPYIVPNTSNHAICS